MDELLKNNIATADLKTFEIKYHEQLTSGCVTPQLKFEYAWCLVQSIYLGDIRRGILLLQNLVERSGALCQSQRDYYFFLAFGHARLKEFRKALFYVKKVLLLEPGNRQAQNFHQLLSKRIRKERISKAIVAGGTVLALGSIISTLGAGSFGFASVAFTRVAPLLFTLARK